MTPHRPCYHVLSPTSSGGKGRNTGGRRAPLTHAQEENRQLTMSAPTVSLGCSQYHQNHDSATLTMCVMQLCHKFVRDWLNQFCLHASCLDKMAASGKNRLHVKDRDQL